MKVPRETTAPDTVENIQALRGIAALLVVWTHLKFPIRELSPGAENELLVRSGFGSIGVDFFFIISGYVICLTACKRHHRPLNFLLARIARVAPLYLTYVLVFLLFKGLGLHRWNTAGSIWNGIFYLPFFDWHEFSWPPGGLGWTMSFEMSFYVSFALLLLFLTPRKVSIYLPVLAAIGTALMVFYHGAWYFPRFVFHPYVLNFAAGCLIFHLQKWIPRALGWSLIVAGILDLVVFSGHTEDLSVPMLASSPIGLAWLRVLLWGLPSALIVLGLVGLECTRALILPHPLVWLGGISYSLYLSHQLSLELVAQLGAHIGLHNVALVSLLAPAVCIFNAWLCWKWIEKPLTTRAQRWAKKLAPALEVKSIPAAS